MSKATILTVDDPMVLRGITTDLRARNGSDYRASIENYGGLPEGLSGADLPQRAVGGAFADADVRLDSMTGVASAVGEGPMSVYLVHRYLAMM